MPSQKLRNVLQRYGTMVPCIFTGCRRWFRNMGGRTKHIRAHHEPAGYISRVQLRVQPEDAHNLAQCPDDILTDDTSSDEDISMHSPTDEDIPMYTPTDEDFAMHILADEDTLLHSNQSQSAQSLRQSSPCIFEGANTQQSSRARTDLPPLRKKYHPKINGRLCFNCCDYVLKLE